MNSKKIKTGIQAIMMSGLVIFFIACHDSDYTKSSAKDSGNTAANNDTAMNNNPVSDTTSGRTSSGTAVHKQGTAMKKKGKITLGSMKANGTEKMIADKEGIYNVTDVMPAYPGGQNALEDYMNNNVEYPQNAIDNNSEGTVKVQFVVDENGNVANAKVVGQKLENGLDEEAVKVVSNMPKWTPGKVKGKNVKTRIVLPITYKLEE